MKSSLVEKITILTLFLVAAFLRTIYLAHFPAGLHGDEAWSGIAAQKILTTGFIGFWADTSFGNPALIYYLVALLFRLLGESTEVLRVAFAIPNILWLPFFYLFCKSVTNKNVALLSFCWLAFSDVSLAFSRKAELLSLSFAFFPSIYYFTKMLNSNKALDYILCGIFLGLCLHMNQPIWITPPVVFLAFFVWSIFKRCFKVKIIYTMVFFLIFSSPILYSAYKSPTTTLARFGNINLFSNESKKHSITHQEDNLSTLNRLKLSFKNTLLMFNYSKSTDYRDIFRNGPVFDKASGIIFIFGLLASIHQIIKKRNFNHVFLWFLLMSFLSSNFFGIDVPTLRRSQPSIYISFIFAGIGLHTIFLLLKKIKIPNLVCIVIISVTIFSISIFNINTYFKNSISTNAKSIMAYPLTKAAEIINLPENSSKHVLFYSDRWSYRYETMRFLVPNHHGQDMSTIFATHSLYCNNANGCLYILMPEYLDSFNRVRHLYPFGKASVYKDKNPESILFYIFKT